MRLAPALALLLAGGGAAAQEGPVHRDVEVPAPPEAPAPAELEPPVPIGPVDVARPGGAPANTEPVLVQVVISIDASGEVDAVRVEQGAGPPWDEAVLVAATHFRFEPARQDGVAVAVEVPFVAHFLPPQVAPPTADGPPLEAVLEGHAVEKGTGRPVPGAAITAVVKDRPYATTTLADGAFHLELPAGSAVIDVTVPGYKDFHQVEALAPGQRVQVRYLVEKQRYNPYETVVIGKRDRVEVSRTTLRGRELTRVPGAFGDPFRAIGAMPGVSSVFSLFGYAVVRGTSPGNTGFLIDGVAVPQIFHYLAGPAVIHPAFIDRIDFWAGAFPARYGGYTGGIVDGITSAPRDPDSLRLSVDPLKTGGLMHKHLGDGSQLAVAGRVGYPALLLSLFNAEVTASYWDYQARWQSADGRLTAFAFGSYDSFASRGNEVASDVTGGSSSGVHAAFHRLDLRYRDGDADDFAVYRVTVGYDDVAGGDAGTSVKSPSVVPRVQLERRLADRLRLRGGLDLVYKQSDGFVGDVSVSQLELASWTLTPGVWADLPWQLSDDVTITPGMRADLYLSQEANHGPFVEQLTLDPRILWRWRIVPEERGETFLKGAVGLYSQPPRFPLAIPGLDQVGLTEAKCHRLYAFPSDCMLQSTQGSLGVERELGAGYGVDAQVYYSWMNPIYFDFTFNDAGLLTQDEQDLLQQRRQGRSYGLEILLRKRDQGTFFGWISYTLSRSERLIGQVWKPYDFDRTHIVQVVGGLQLPRNWELGGRLLVQTGRPTSGPFELLERQGAFWRLDLRIDKRVVYRGMLFDFYVEVLNTAVVPEPVSTNDGAPYVLPYFGLEWILPL